MKRWAWLFVIAVFLPIAAGCALTPFTERERFPQRNTDSTLGLLGNGGTASLNVWIYDRAGRLIEEIYMPGATPPLPEIGVRYLYNHRAPVVIAKRLPPGSYRVEYIPFYYQFVGGQRVDLPRGSASIYVGRDPKAVYDRITARHWGWKTILHGGDIPRGPQFLNLGLRIGCC